MLRKPLHGCRPGNWIRKPWKEAKQNPPRWHLRVRQGLAEPPQGAGQSFSKKAKASAGTPAFSAPSSAAEGRSASLSVRAGGVCWCSRVALPLYPFLAVAHMLVQPLLLEEPYGSSSESGSCSLKPTHVRLHTLGLCRFCRRRWLTRDTFCDRIHLRSRCLRCL